MLLLFGSVAIAAFLEQSLGTIGFRIVNLFSSFLLLFFMICLSRLLSLIPGVSAFLAFIGKDSLYLNGNEMIFKNLFSLLFGVLGLKQLVYQNDAVMALYCFLLMILLTFTVNLLERLLFGKLFGEKRG